ncbi:MAG: methylmalonyl Co-A mutase-associated GTPase MeaB [Thermodesulfobacteriota bacterium]
MNPGQGQNGANGPGRDSDIVNLVRQGDVRAVARLIRDFDDGAPSAVADLKQLFPFTGRAYVLGVTGSPGVGKSTLVDGLVRHVRGLGLTVGVLAVDPSSPFTGGAILGDRVRMQRHSTDEGVFIRSMATRGHFGGLSRSTRGAIMILDASGKDVIIVETVGVGQDEVDIARTADTTVIVVAPGLGDDIQAIKAGILEVGDIFVVNKADREGAERTVQDLQSMIELGRVSDLGTKDWTPPVLKAVGLKQEGVAELWAAAAGHRAFLHQGRSDYYQRLARLKAKMEIIDLVKQGVVDVILKRLDETGELEQYLDELISRKTDPYSLSDKIMARVLAE